MISGFLRSVRCRSVQVAAMLLMLQTGWLVAPVWALACGHADAQASTEEDDCCGGLHPGQMCPLHRRGGAREHAPSRSDHQGTFRVRPSCDPPSPLLQSLMLGLADGPAAATELVIDRPLNRPLYRGLFRKGSLPPDLPPPRS